MAKLGNHLASPILNRYVPCFHSPSPTRNGYGCRVAWVSWYQVGFNTVAWYFFLRIYTYALFYFA
jgi:hypothetical protein